jgi:hypothetical protein
MKRLLIVLAILMLAGSAAAESRLLLAAGAAYMRPADENFRSIYGNQAIYPELSASIRLIGGLCLTGSAGKLSKDGRTPDLGLEATASQSYIAMGLAYVFRASPTLCFEAGAGVAGLSFREDALDLWVKGKHPGFKAEGGILLLPEDERVFMGLKIGYLTATVPGSELEPVGDRDVRLGGLKVSVSIGIQLFGQY